MAPTVPPHLEGSIEGGCRLRKKNNGGKYGDTFTPVKKRQITYIPLIIYSTSFAFWFSLSFINLIIFHVKHLKKLSLNTI